MVATANLSVPDLEEEPGGYQGQDRPGRLRGVRPRRHPRDPRRRDRRRRLGIRAGQHHRALARPPPTERKTLPGFFAAIAETLDVTEFTPLAFTANDTDVMAVIRFGFTVKDTGRSATMDLHHWWRFRDDKITWYRGTEDTALTARVLAPCRTAQPPASTRSLPGGPARTRGRTRGAGSGRRRCGWRPCRSDVGVAVVVSVPGPSVR